MNPVNAPDVTLLLHDWKNGDEHAIERLTTIVYDELRRLAVHYLRDEHAADTLQPTALVHEAYIRLVSQKTPDWEGRAHFFGVAAHLMRQILVDHARARLAKKRDGGCRVTLAEDLAVAPAGEIDVLAVDEALGRLAGLDVQQARVVELRYFGGLSIRETSEVLGISEATVKRDWATARAWLHREMESASRA